MPYKDIEKRREWARKYCAKHRKKISDNANRRRSEHPEKKREYERLYRLSHLEKTRKRIKIAQRKYRLDHPEKVLAYTVSHRNENRQRSRKYRLAKPEKYKASIRKWQNVNREHMNAYYREYGKNHPELIFIRSSVARMLKIVSCKKTARSYKYIGCTPGFLRNHIEDQFKPGMTWENYGEWHIDHIVPISWFPFERDPSLLFVASHWTNLQPLWAEENLSKHDRYAVKAG